MPSDERSLDPDDWSQARKIAHRMVDDAVPSDTSLDGAHCLRVAINNHRTRRADLDLFVAELVRIGDAVASEAAATPG